MIGAHTPWYDPNAGSSTWSIADTMGPQTQQTYATQDDEADFESDGTDTDTSSDDGERIPIDFTSWNKMSQGEAGQEIYWMYKTAKKAWRRFSHKPVRKARRFAKRKGSRKGKGKHRGKNAGMFLSQDLVMQSFLKQKGRFPSTSKSSGKGKSKGYGFGRRSGNPIGADGKQMECHTCKSKEHLKAQCPQGAGTMYSLTQHLLCSQ